MADTVKLLKALGDPGRLAVFSLLCGQKELCVCDITAALDITQTHASRSLGVLKNSGLVKDRRDGLWMHYSAVKTGYNAPVAGFVAAMSTSDKKLGGVLKRAKEAVKKSICPKKQCESVRKRG